jgi:hypothetical protein
MMRGHARTIRAGIMRARQWIADGRRITKGHIFIATDSRRLYDRAVARTLEKHAPRVHPRSYHKNTTDYVDGHSMTTHRIYARV